MCKGPEARASWTHCSWHAQNKGESVSTTGQKEVRESSQGVDRCHRQRSHWVSHQSPTCALDQREAVSGRNPCHGGRSQQQQKLLKPGQCKMEGNLTREGTKLIVVKIIPQVQGNKPNLEQGPFKQGGRPRQNLVPQNSKTGNILSPKN